MPYSAPELPAAFELSRIKDISDLRKYSSKLARQGSPEGTIIWAEYQTSARGRLNQEWICNKGDLHCSVILQPEFPASQYGELAIVATVAMGNALATHSSPMIALGYAWPNNITIAGHKVGGVWLDGDPNAETPWLCVTTSINILNSPPDYSIPAMSIAEAEGGTELNSKVLLETFARQFITQINTWSERGVLTMVNHWKIRAEGIGKTIKFQTKREAIQGMVHDIDHSGNLLIENHNGVHKITLCDAFDLRCQIDEK